MTAKSILKIVIVVSSIISFGFAQNGCSVCEKSSFLDKYFLKIQRATEEINSQLRQYPLTSWERSRAIENVLFPLKYSFAQLMGIAEWRNAYLGSSKVVFRDLNNFDQIDETIKSSEFNIWGTNVLWNKVPKDFLNKFFGSYQTLGVVKIDQINSTANWEDLFNGLWAINFINRHYRAKAALGEWYQPILSGKDLINLFNRALGGKIKISLSKSDIAQLQAEYECLAKVYGVCEKNEKGEDVYQRVKKIVDSFSDQGSQTIEKFTTSFNRLKEALQKFNTSGGFWRKNWINLSAKMKMDGAALVDYDVMAGKQFGFSWAQTASKILEEAQLKKLFGEARVNNMPDSMDLVRIIYLSWYGIEDTLKKDQKENQVAIQQSLKKLDFVLKKAIAQDVAIGTSWEPRTYTLKIVNLSTQIHKTLQIIGSKDEENSLIRLLGNACELQCGNLGGKCWAD